MAEKKGKLYTKLIIGMITQHHVTKHGRPVRPFNDANYVEPDLRPKSITIEEFLRATSCLNTMQLVPRLLDLEKVFTPPTENKKTEEMIDYIRTLRKPDRTWLELSPDKRSSEFKV